MSMGAGLDLGHDFPSDIAEPVITKGINDCPSLCFCICFSVSVVW